AEETSARDRAAAVALVAAGYAAGAGASAIVHSLTSGTLGFRGICALTIVPLVLVYMIRDRIEEPSRFMVAEAAADHPTPVIGAVGPRFRRRVFCLSLISFAIAIVTGPANSFVFLYAQDVVHQKGYWTALMVVISGAAGLCGLLVGRWMADTVGRRPTATLALVVAALAATLAYSGSRLALIVGYSFGVLSGGLIAPAVGSLLAELFPTSVRASVTGWWVTSGVLGAVVGLVEFGTVADVGNRFAEAAAITFLPMTLAAGLFWLVPETRGKEPEMLWPD
ncbi:MAG TPA: MFS transporter, partial [Acidimicrobiales bacterium]